MAEGSGVNITLVDLGLGKLSKPLTKLIGAVQSAIGTLYEPRRIRSEASAQADALVILAEGREAATEVAYRTARRIEHRELRRQQNIDAIVRMSANELTDSVDDKPVNVDWVARFFNHCEDVSDEKMQGLWARLLAGEVSHPGSFSPRTLQVVSVLTEADASIFTQFCCFVWTDEATPFGAIQGEGACDKYWESVGISPTSVSDLRSMGLVGETFGVRVPEGDPFSASYFGRPFLFSPEREDDHNLTPRKSRAALLGFNSALNDPFSPFGSLMVRPDPSSLTVEKYLEYVTLTAAGRELFPICGAVCDDEYLRLMLSDLRAYGLTIQDVSSDSAKK